MLVNFKQQVNTDKAVVKVRSISESQVEVDIDDIVVEPQENGPEYDVNPWVVIGITEDHLSGITRLQNLEQTLPGPDTELPRIVIDNPNNQITIVSVQFFGTPNTASATQAGTTGVPTIDAAVGTLLANDVKVFPNPTTGQFTVKFDTDVQIDQLSIMSLLGKVVHTTIMPQKNNMVDLSDLPPGIYFVEAQAGSKRVAKRVVVDR